jgi:hypothetical protein
MKSQGCKATRMTYHNEKKILSFLILLKIYHIEKIPQVVNIQDYFKPYTTALYDGPILATLQI